MSKFQSKSHVAINVVLANGTNVHVTFMEVTGGGSVYYTNNQEIADALRRHQKFGKLFKEVAMPEPKPVAPVKKQAATEKPAEDGGAGKTENVKEFANNEDAKDYLAERYGISRSKMRTKAAIEEVAKGLGIKVKWTK